MENEEQHEKWWDLPSSEEFLTRQQYDPWKVEYTMSSLTRQVVEREKEPTESAKKAVEYAKSFLGEEYEYSVGGSRQDENPLREGNPESMNSASFVYWIFNLVNVPLRGGNHNHTIQTIKNDFGLEVVGTIGGSRSLEMLSLGDIILFNHDKHIGIYSGEGNFISFIPLRGGSSKGVVKELKMDKGKWYEYYQGHILRDKGVKIDEQ